MKKHIPNVLTLCNLLTGCLGIYFVFEYKEFSFAIVFVLIAGFFDWLDGWLARRMKVESNIGKQLDSFADLVSFGLLPAFCVILAFHDFFLYSLLAFLMPIFSVLRLSAFNTQTNKEQQFLGLPTPANAWMVTALFFVPHSLNPYFVWWICMGTAILQVIPVPLISLKFLSFGWKENKSRWIFIIGSVVLLVFLQTSATLLIIPYYLLVSVVHFYK